MCACLDDDDDDDAIKPNILNWSLFYQDQQILQIIKAVIRVKIAVLFSKECLYIYIYIYIYIYVCVCVCVRGWRWILEVWIQFSVKFKISEIPGY